MARLFTDRLAMTAMFLFVQIELLDTVALNLHRIDKDVQRCDRNYYYFTTANLEKLRNIMCRFETNRGLAIINDFAFTVDQIMHRLTFPPFDNYLHRQSDLLKGGHVSADFHVSSCCRAKPMKVTRILGFY